ncbi:hypothetical protein FIE12Z_6680 [Fusarium flagelliforme]|uniref:Uncharacterized protein n=1 Tax=Fusarium flagelliforme TaxID=2675880 RepID=A0A395MMJ5_9HYPO|nr:hypothetical protein FIE12Z_6680 [Fusarium flagelliforme]
MVSRTFFASALAAFSAQAVVAGPCRPVSSSIVQVSFSSAATDSASTTLVPSSTETLSTETETLETSLTVPTTDGTTSTVIEEAATTTTEAFTTTELTTSDATSYQSTETTIVEHETTTAPETTTTAGETTTTAALVVPTPFNLIYDMTSGDSSYTLFLQGPPQTPNDVYLADFPTNNAQSASFTYDSETGQVSIGSQSLCIHPVDRSWNAQVKRCSAEPMNGGTPLFCEKPSRGGLKCRTPGPRCECPPEIPDCPLSCNPAAVWSQFMVKETPRGTLLYFGIEGASGQQLAAERLEPISLEAYEINN